MREYVLHEARSRLAYGRLTGLVRFVRNWKARNDMKQMLAMDDYILRDIGVTRDELLRFSRFPLTQDWQWLREQEDLHR